MNNDAFRNRFLERNRPWLIAHMAELLTPRTLDTRGPAGDGASTAAYVRGVYEQLAAMSAQSVEVGEDDDDTRAALLGEGEGEVTPWGGSPTRRRGWDV